MSARPELDKLGHQLGVPAERLGVLAHVPAGDLRALRGQIAEALFEADRHHFTRMATLARTVPIPVAARITVLALPPLLAARTAELFEPHRAVEMVLRLPDAYLADVSAVMDPARSPEVVAAIPPESVAVVAVELARRGEWVVMGAFVSYVSMPALEATVARLTGGQLLRIGYVLDDASRLGDISAMLTVEQLDEMLQAAVDDSLWRELDELLARLEPAHARRLAERYAALPEMRTAVAAAVSDGAFSAAGRDALAGR